MAKTNIKSFMTSRDLEKKDWDLVSKAAKHRIKAEQTEKLSYTPLHSWIQAHPDAKIEQMENEAQKNNKENYFPMTELEQSKN